MHLERHNSKDRRDHKEVQKNESEMPNHLARSKKDSRQTLKRKGLDPQGRVETEEMRIQRWAENLFPVFFTSPSLLVSSFSL